MIFRLHFNAFLTEKTIKPCQSFGRNRKTNSKIMNNRFHLLTYKNILKTKINF